MGKSLISRPFGMTLKQAKESSRVTLSPCGGYTQYAQDAANCLGGCPKCFAMALQGARSSVDKAWRFNHSMASHLAKTGDSKTWIDSCVYQIKHYRVNSHRWFTAGDLIGLNQLIAIVGICDKTQGVRHELRTVRQDLFAEFYKTGIAFPKNLKITLATCSK